MKALRQSLTAQVSPATMAEIKNRVAPDGGGRLDSGQMAATLMLKNCAATLRIAAIKTATAKQPKSAAANRAALAAAMAPETQGAKNAKRLAAATETQRSKNAKRLSQITKK
ncbi:MAG: hypothetical protein HHJ17_02755 [Rhodoferax sp.]|uniref:hypothetical protein n=1 Tax=Rhodoferax sp. TaxID=50421 RepID=UPI0018061A7F|nr:hypothetical protein [Rhodoferax sp.]NMM12450.1 hypothetical protein [Rhodoferax sp.]